MLVRSGLFIQTVASLLVNQSFYVCMSSIPNMTSSCFFADEFRDVTGDVDTYSMPFLLVGGGEDDNPDRVPHPCTL